MPSVKIVVCTTGSIGVIAVPQFIVWMRSELSVEVRVLMSASARRFVTALTMRAVSGHDALVDLFEDVPGMPVPHVQVVSDAALLLVLPATANVIARAAAGMGDDVITASILCATCPVIFAPCMSQAMWRNHLVQRNVQTLRGAGHDVMEPGQGIELGTMRSEIGALPNLRDVAARIRRVTWRPDAAEAAPTRSDASVLTREPENAS